MLYSFLHISRPEIDLPADDRYPQRAGLCPGEARTCRASSARGAGCRTKASCYYVYRQKMGGITQTGLVVCAGGGRLPERRHQEARADQGGQGGGPGPAHRCARCQRRARFSTPTATIRPSPTASRRSTSGAPLSTTSPPTTVSPTPCGRWATRADRGADRPFRRDPRPLRRRRPSPQRRRQPGAGAAERGKSAPHRQRRVQFFLTVIFPDNEMTIMPYNRVVKDLNGRQRRRVHGQGGEHFDITPVPCRGQPGRAPSVRHVPGREDGTSWCPQRDSSTKSDPVASMDVSILQDNLLGPVLGVRNPRTDQRIHFVGGIRGVAELERVVNSGEYEVAFSLYPDFDRGADGACRRQERSCLPNRPGSSRSSGAACSSTCSGEVETSAENCIVSRVAGAAMREFP